MFNYQDTLAAMRTQRASMQQELDRLDRAISALQAVVGSPAPAKGTPKPSVQSRRQVAQPQAKRTTKSSTDEKKTESLKPKISAQGLRNIIEAQRKRWAKVRAAAKAQTKLAGNARAKPTAGKRAS